VVFGQCGHEVRLNGVGTGSRTTAISRHVDWFTINSGSVKHQHAGFVVNNGGTSVNPIGLRVELSGTPISKRRRVPRPRFARTGFGQRRQGTRRIPRRCLWSKPLSYQWRLNEQPIPNATNAT